MWKSLHNKHGIAFKQCGLLGQVPSPGLLRLHWLGHLPALLAPLASLPLKVLLNTTQQVKCRKELRLSVTRRLVIFKVRLVIL